MCHIASCPSGTLHDSAYPLEYGQTYTGGAPQAKMELLCLSCGKRCWKATTTSPDNGGCEDARANEAPSAEAAGDVQCGTLRQLNAPAEAVKTKAVGIVH